MPTDGIEDDYLIPCSAFIKCHDLEPLDFRLLCPERK